MENLRETIFKVFKNSGIKNLILNDIGINNTGEIILVDISKNIFDITFSINYYEKDNDKGKASSINIISIHSEDNFSKYLLNAITLLSEETKLNKIHIFDGDSEFVEFNNTNK